MLIRMVLIQSSLLTHTHTLIFQCQDMARMVDLYTQNHMDIIIFDLTLLRTMGVMLHLTLMPTPARDMGFKQGI